MRIIRNWRFAGIALALFMVTTAACSGTEKSICDKRRQCLGGNDLDFNACVQRYIYEGKIASDYACADAWNSLLTCMDTTGICNTAIAKVFTDSCNAQRSSLEACEKASSVKGGDHFLTTDSQTQSAAPASAEIIK